MWEVKEGKMRERGEEEIQHCAGRAIQKQGTAVSMSVLAVARIWFELVSNHLYLHPANW